MSNKLSIIWTLTRVCGWSCGQCCVNALWARRSGTGSTVHLGGLSNPTCDQIGTGESFLTTAIRLAIGNGLELSTADKCRVVDLLAEVASTRPVEVDISGGEPFAAHDCMKVLRYARERLGRDALSITATGMGLAQQNPSDLSQLVSCICFTADEAPDQPNSLRPIGYNHSNLHWASRFAKYEVTTKAQMPLTRKHLKGGAIENIYRSLHDAEVDHLLAMRIFPVGRGTGCVGEIPNREEYKAAIARLRILEKEFGTPTVSLQCALRGLESIAHSPFEPNPCDAGVGSLGITATGDVLISAWAVTPDGTPMPEWLIGNLRDTPLSTLLCSSRVADFASRNGENFGHCKIHATIATGRMFGGGDPLYSSKLDIRPQEYDNRLPEEC